MSKIKNIFFTTKGSILIMNHEIGKAYIIYFKVEVPKRFKVFVFASAHNYEIILNLMNPAKNNIN